MTAISPSSQSLFQRLISNKYTPFWLLTFGILIGLTLPVLIQDGMFMDAMLYTSVSHNLSQGIGTFWYPQFSECNVAGLASFHEQPPLVFGIQAVFYKIFGDSMYVERFYTFLTMCVNALLIGYLWKNIFEEKDETRKLSWLPMILWISVPVCFWSFSNNMHENTMGIFTSAAVLFIYKAMKAGQKNMMLLITGAIFIILSTLSKGLPGFFPFGIPLIWWVTTKGISFKKAMTYTVILIAVTLLGYVILFVLPESRGSLNIYFFKRALHRINAVPTVDSHFSILWRLFTELIPQMALVLIFLVSAKIRKATIIFAGKKREYLFWILTGLSASAPLMLTLVQKGFYFVPSLPFFAIASALMIAPMVLSMIQRIDVKSKGYFAFLFISFAAFSASIVITGMQKGKFSRNKDLLHDVYTIGKLLPPGSIVTVPSEMWNNWDLQCSMIRYTNISVETSHNREYRISDRMVSDDLTNYEKVNIGTVQYDLYKKK